MTKHLRFLIVLLMTLVWSTGGAQTTVFHETFDKCSSSGGNDGKWGTTGLNSTAITDATKSKFLDQAWTDLATVFPANKCVRLSSGNNPATMITPTISSTGDFIIKIKAGGCTGKSSIINLKTSNGNLDKPSVSLTAGKFNEYSIELTGVTQSFTLTFNIAKGKQSFIDDIEVISKSTQKESGISFGETTYTANITDKDGTYRSYVSLTNPNNLSVTYSSSKTDVAEVNNNGEVEILGVGTTTISAAFAGDDTYMKATVSYELTVVDPNAPVVKFVGGVDKGGNTAYNKPDKIIKDGITIEGANAALGADNVYKFYANADVSISVETGTITKIEFAVNNDTYRDSKSLKDLSGDGYKAESDLKGTWIGNAPKVVLNAKKQVRATTITVYVSLPTSETTALTLDETATNNNIVAKTGVNVTLKRTMKAGVWNTICLPFEVSEDKAKTAFGDGMKIAALDAKSSTGTTLKFDDYTTLGIPAATPCLIKPSDVKTSNEYVFENVKITAENVNPGFNKTDDGFVFVGIYDKADITDNIKTRFPSCYAAFLGANNTVYKANPVTVPGKETKGFRAYFAIPNSVKASELRVVIDGTATSIKNIDSEVVESNAPVYNLQGQRVDGNNLTPGIYVKAGKKFVVK